VTDYQIWLDKVRAALERTGSKSGPARWIADRLGLKPKGVDVRLHQMLGGLVPRATFTAAVDAWMAAGCPSPAPPVSQSEHARKGGQARAAKLTPEQRTAIAKKARAARN
jgi:hypothetical protein